MSNTSTIFLTAVFAFVALPLNSSLSLAGVPDKELELKCVRPVVQLIDRCGFGSGTIIRSEKDGDDWINVVLTCKHVVQRFTEPYAVVIAYKDWSAIDRSKCKRYPARIIAKHPYRDMALMMFLSKKQMPVADLGMDEKLYFGNEIIGVGCGSREVPRLDYGRITGIDEISIRAGLLAIPGDSGGPVFHNKKLIAIKQKIASAQINGVIFPTFNNSQGVRITVLKKWAERESKAAIYKKETTLPKLPRLMLKAREFRRKTSFLDLFLVPDTHF